MSPEIVIRRAETVADYRACQEAQRLAWGITEDGYIVPVATMVGAQHHGGLVLGAFLPDGTAVGLSFSFPGRTEGRLCLYSQLTGVVPGYQGRKVGGRLKTAQREIARSEGVPCIAWAFDPLQAGNAHFNLENLGATVGRHIENMYGFRSDALNRDTPTDRLIAVWETDPERVAKRPVIETIDGLPRLIGVSHGVRFEGLPKAPIVLLEVPADINRMRCEAPEAAENWGRAVGEGFRAAFAGGYRGVGFHREDGRGYYVLEAGPDGSRQNGSDIHRE